MNRDEKIKLLNGLKSGEKDLKRFVIENEFPLPSWYWQQFETKEELLADQKKERGEKIIIVWHEGKPYLINNNPKPNKPLWFNYEK